MSIIPNRAPSHEKHLRLLVGVCWLFLAAGTVAVSLANVPMGRRICWFCLGCSSVSVFNALGLLSKDMPVRFLSVAGFAPAVFIVVNVLLTSQ